MYQKYFNFNSAPFSIAPDPHFIFMSEQHQEGLALLLYGIRQEGGFVALTGEVGTGKTTLCHCLLEQLPDNVDIALVLNPKLNTLELLATICDELQIKYDEDKQSIKPLIDRINKHLLAAHADNRKTILMIDEAQNLSLDVLEQIRLLTNLETSKSKLLQIILVGQPELKLLLEKPELRQLNQRITARYHLNPLSFSETRNYISHRLAISGGQTSLFSRAAIKKVYQLSKGIPRLVNVICDRALLGAYATNQKRIKVQTIIQAANENFNTSHASVTPFAKTLSLSITLLAILISATYFINKTYLPYDFVNLPLQGKQNIEEQKSASLDQKQTLDKPAEPQKTVEIINPGPISSPQPKDFKVTIKQHNFSLNTALPDLIRTIDPKIPENSDCTQLKVLGVECLFDQSSWQKLVALNRPVIMEFSISATTKVYGLLIELNASDAIFQFDSAEFSFPIEQVLANWDGYYLLLWQPPIKNITFIYPQQTSQAVLWLREQLSVDDSELIDSKQSDFFDDKLENLVVNFQIRNNLSVDGIVGYRTFIQLQNEDLQNNYPKLRNK